MHLYRSLLNFGPLIYDHENVDQEFGMALVGTMEICKYQVRLALFFFDIRDIERFIISRIRKHSNSSSHLWSLVTTSGIFKKFRVKRGDNCKVERSVQRFY